jgi:hypothetical protein
MSGRRPGPAASRFLLPLVVLLALVFPAAAQSDEEPLLARAFQVRYRPLDDAADVVYPLLSRDGTLTLRPRVGVLVVEDRESVLKRVGSLLESFDLPPKNVEVTLSLVMGAHQRTRGAAPRRDPGRAFSKEVRGVLDNLEDFTKWVAYEPLGSRSVTGVEGDEVTANLSDDYRVVFTIESVHESQGLVKFERVSLQRVERSEEDGESEFRDLYTAAMVLTAGQLHVVGAAREPNSNQALFLIVQVKAR